MSTSPSGYVTAFGVARVPTPGLEGGVGCNPRVTFDGNVRNLGLRANSLCLQIRYPPSRGPQSPHPVDSRQFPPPLRTRRGLRLDPRHQCLPDLALVFVFVTVEAEDSDPMIQAGYYSVVSLCLLLQYLLQSCSRGGRGIERRRDY